MSKVFRLKVEEKEVGGFKTKLFFLDEFIIGIPTEIGPRILYFASTEKPEFNLFGVLPDVGMQTSEGFWRVYGGHRLWSSPEAKPRSYSLDNKPVKIETDKETVTVHGNPETANSVQKTISIRPHPKGGIQVIHTIRNIGRWPITLACWALSIMKPKGFAIIPIQSSKVDEEGLLPDRHITIWPYTDLSDKRLTFTNDFIFIRQDPEVESPVKIGTMANPSWTAYWVEGVAFVKEFQKKEGEYPDFGCNVEVYTNANMLELETLSPLQTLEPNDTIRHTEIWRIFDVGELTPTSEKIKGNLEPLIG
ncbi:hypothetical protein DRO38_03615 [Candidatus Bathyarchaeota archaeon]|nr:MAG: hypothetical protein DRO38_03615 [Candidatus Bathyarchaeota archaeon]